MKILILGADGMLGHQLVQSWRNRHELVGTVRLDRSAYSGHAQFLPERVVTSLDARDNDEMRRLIERERPDAVVNAIGIVKQRPAAKDAIDSIEVNALLPHRLAVACAQSGSRLVHLSTDCVFSGSRGMYTESDPLDACDLYGRTKALGEVGDVGCVTLRTSIIGLELTRKKSLVEWFLAQRGTIGGYRNAIYSGLTTLEMARVIERVIARSDLHGIYHVSSDPIDKFTLLQSLRDRLGKTIEIVPDDDFHCNRSMDSTRFRDQLPYEPPTWGAMLDELAIQIEERYG